jgi:CGNR zinc finger
LTQFGGSASFAARRAAALLAVLDPREPGLPHGHLVAAVTSVLMEYGEHAPVVLTPQDITGMRAVAAELWPVFAAQTVGQAAGRLNNVLATYAGPPRLTSHDGTTWHIHADGADDSPWPRWFAASSAIALATLLAGRQAPPGGLCASSRCGRPFIDLGRGGRRRYCSARCATRERVAAHRRS